MPKISQRGLNRDVMVCSLLHKTEIVCVMCACVCMYGRTSVRSLIAREWIHQFVPDLVCKKFYKGQTPEELPWVRVPVRVVPVAREVDRRTASKLKSFVSARILQEQTSLGRKLSRVPILLKMYSVPSKLLIRKHVRTTPYQRGDWYRNKRHKDDNCPGSQLR